MTNKDGISVEGGSWIERTYAASLDKPILERLKEARSSPMIYERDGWGARTCNLVADAQAHIEAQERAYLALSEQVGVLEGALNTVRPLVKQWGPDKWLTQLDAALSHKGMDQ